jgi:hypothetical protein
MQMEAEHLSSVAGGYRSPPGIPRPNFEALPAVGVETESSRLRSIGTCRVTGSSGCHRYGYWNEQFLFDGRPDTGWCTPSRKVRRVEFLEIETGTTVPIVRLRMRSRAINPEAGFPRTVILYTKAMGSNWAERARLRTAPLAADCWHDWALPAFEAPQLRIEFDDIAIRPEGKYFLQFMALELFSEV